MSVYMLPALIGLALKLLILSYAVKGRNGSSPIVLLVIIFACHNMVELIGYALLIDGKTVEMLFRSYYVLTIVGLVCILKHSIDVGSVKRPYVIKTMAFMGFCVASAILFSNTVVAGHYSIGYAISAIKGNYYLAFVVFNVVALAVAIFCLVRGFRSALTMLESNRCAYTLMALTPVILITPVVLLLKTTGADVNAAGVIPIATTLFVFILLKGESEHLLTDVRRFLPGSPERRTAARFIELADTYTRKIGDGNSYSDLRDGVERQIILYTIEKCGGNLSETTRVMGLPHRSTLYSMMRRLKINPEAARKELS